MIKSEIGYYNKKLCIQWSTLTCYKENWMITLVSVLIDSNILLY